MKKYKMQKVKFLRDKKTLSAGEAAEREILNAKVYYNVIIDYSRYKFHT